ncbi:hypothetical protein NDU88_004625 [Pleurodeles waltl]|uniref:Uncharacterized protein n=1 Tax=Pleurodeles waltl TaxID=8319 RepID=A0AAV7VJH1_PLEWA|nr:hypothetical protein NDU88_004625 [Pleurodeles waltl]
MMRDAALANKERKAQQATLETDIRQLTRQCMDHPSLPMRRRLEGARLALNELYTSQAKYALQRIQGRHYEQGEKAGRLLVGTTLPENCSPSHTGT